MNFRTFEYLIKSDLHRYPVNDRFFLCMIRQAGFCYTFFMRLCRYLKGKILLLPLYLFARIMLRYYKFKFGIEIPFTTKIGPGFKISHFGTIVFNSETIIGKNFSIHQGVTLGTSGKANEKEKAPKIGDNVYVGSGAKIIGDIKVGNNVVIGANAVVTRDIPDNSIVVGNPAKIVSKKGSKEFVDRPVD